MVYLVTQFRMLERADDVVNMMLFRGIFYVDDERSRDTSCMLHAKRT